MTKIEWTNKTWNPVTGCTKISPGCAHCYAERMAKRLAGRCGYPEAPHQFDVTLHPEKMGQPLKWRKPSMIFVCSMGDLFHDDVPFWFIDDVWSTMASCNHTFQVLTKRPERVLEWYSAMHSFRDKLAAPLDNVWLGVTAENQDQANKRIPVLLQIPAAVRFVSVEPMLGRVDIGLLGTIPSYWPYAPLCTKIDWVICGAETGPGKRPMNLDWARDLRDQCQDAGVPFFFKKDSNGNRELDGVLWEQYPEVR